MTEPAWISAEGPDSDIALSTRLRLARNLEQFPFPPTGQTARLAEVLSRVAPAVAGLPGMQWRDALEVSPLEQHLLVERHLLSPAFVASPLPRGLAWHEGGRLSLMVNEEDHLRLQCLLPGLNFDDAWEEIGVLEQVLAERLPFAFDDQLGYLTACPSNVGTGLRASAMLHLPALAWLKQLDAIVGQVGQLGLTVRGVYGEGSRSAGSLIQISNQVTLGPSEPDILAKIRAVSEQLVQYERSSREQLARSQGRHLEDRVWRCLGLLATARLIVADEAMEHLSLIRMGVGLGMLPAVPIETLTALMVRIRPANLSLHAGRELHPGERDFLRAELLRQNLAPYLHTG